MEIFPYIGITDFNFQENIESIKNKLSKFKTIHVGDKVEMDRKFPSIYVQDVDLFIVFLEGGNSIRYFEMGSDIYHAGKNLYKESLNELKQFYSEKDKDIEILDDGFDSPLFGLRITKNEDKKGNLIGAYSKEYLGEPKITPEDIINFYLKE